MKCLRIDGGSISFEDLKLFMEGKASVALSPQAKKRLLKVRAFVDRKLSSPSTGSTPGSGYWRGRGSQGRTSRSSRRTSSSPTPWAWESHSPRISRAS